jgi:hypothetical protein
MGTTRLMLVSSRNISDEELEEFPMGTTRLMLVFSIKSVNEDMQELPVCTNLPPFPKRTTA